MEKNENIALPESGLAEDILAHFVEQSQQEPAVAAPVPQEEQRGDSVLQVVTFSLADEEYGVEIGNVQEIIRAANITPVPGAPQHVKGVINLRGKIIPVIDLRRRFGLGEGDDSDARRIIVIELGEKRLGMLVDAVSQVLKVPATVIDDLPEEAAAIEDRYIRGIAKMEQKLVIILDLQSTFLTSEAR